MALIGPRQRRGSALARALASLITPNQVWREPRWLKSQSGRRPEAWGSVCRQGQGPGPAGNSLQPTSYSSARLEPGVPLLLRWAREEGCLATDVSRPEPRALWVFGRAAGSPEEPPERNVAGTRAPQAGFGLIFYAARELSISAPSKTNAASGWPPGPPIYHHLIYIKVLSPLIAKTNKKKLHQSWGSNRQEVGGVWGLGAGRPREQRVCCG